MLDILLVLIDLIDEILTNPLKYELKIILFLLVDYWINLKKLLAKCFFIICVKELENSLFLHAFKNNRMQNKCTSLHNFYLQFISIM